MTEYLLPVYLVGLIVGFVAFTGVPEFYGWKGMTALLLWPLVLAALTLLAAAVLLTVTMEYLAETRA